MAKLPHISAVLLALVFLACSTPTNPQNEVVQVDTTLGSFKIALFGSLTPLATENFRSLVASGYYDNTIFHVVQEDFVIQGGDPSGTGTNGSSIWGEPFEDEFVPGLVYDAPGQVGMANRGPNTNGSQFFITLAPLPQLTGKHTLFGRVTSGMKVIEAISRVETDSRSRPVEPVEILRCQLVTH